MPDARLSRTDCCSAEYARHYGKEICTYRERIQISRSHRHQHQVLGRCGEHGSGDRCPYPARSAHCRGREDGYEGRGRQGERIPHPRAALVQVRGLTLYLCNLAHCLHHALGHAFLAGPVEADFVAVGVVEVGVAPAPFHHARHLGDVEALAHELLAEIVELAHFEVEAHAIAHQRRARPRLVQRDGAVSTGGSQPGIDGGAVEAKIFDELEPQQVTVEADRAGYVFDVNHGVVEGEFAVVDRYRCNDLRRPFWRGFCGRFFRRGFLRWLRGFCFQNRLRSFRWTASGDLLRRFFRGFFGHTSHLASST